jgi:hypothetical protein
MLDEPSGLHPRVPRSDLLVTFEFSNAFGSLILASGQDEGPGQDAMPAGRKWMMHFLENVT